MNARRILSARLTRPTILLVLVATLALAGCVSPPESHKSHDETPPPSSYGPLIESPIRGLTAEQIDAYANGKGASMALPAELNGYPGPTHVLDLAEPLSLTETQQAAMAQLRDQMRADAIARGSELLALHKALDDGFRNGTLDGDALADLLDEIGREEAALRYVHLRTHFDAANLLTPHQKALYVELRGYGRADHTAHEH